MAPLIEEESRRGALLRKPATVQSMGSRCRAWPRRLHQSKVEQTTWGEEREGGGLIEWNASENKAIRLGGVGVGGGARKLEGNVEPVNRRVARGSKLGILALAVGFATSAEPLEQLGSGGDASARI